MRRLGLRGRLFVLSVVVMVCCGLPAALYLESELRGWLEERVQNDVARQAELLTKILWPLPPLDKLDEEVDVLGHAAAVRLTVVAEDGRVLADSQVPTQRLTSLESHRERPEIVAARLKGRGFARRYSNTLKTNMLYVAVRAPENVTVRAAVPLSEVEAVMDRLHIIMALAILLALLVATGMTLVASRLLALPVRRLLERTQPLVQASGGPSHQTDSINVLATQLDHAVATLAQERDRLFAILNALTDGVVVVDADEQVSLSNPAAQEFLGREALRPEDIEPFSAALQEPVEWTPEGVSPARIVVARAAPLNFGGHVVVLHDVSERRRLENIRKDFIANVSHELRTPVSILRANAETLLDRGLDDPEHGRGFAEAILRHAERLGRLISDLLDLSRLEAGRMRLWMQPVVLADAVEVARASLQDRARSRSVSVTIDSHSDVAAMADAKGVDQILYNLLDNALKHAPEGGRVNVQISAENRKARVCIDDNGPGITPEQRERIFERFYRVDPGRSRDQGGTGLGLAIVRNWAEVLGGAVGADESPDGGARFWLELPRVSDSMRPTKSN